MDCALLFLIGISFESLYKISKKLRSIQSGNVYVAKHILTQIEHLVVVINRFQLEVEHDVAVSRVVEQLERMSSYHRDAQLINFFQTPTSYYIVYHSSSVGGRAIDRDQCNAITGKNLPFDILYTISRPICSGSFGTVSTAKYNWTQREVAVKVIDRQKLKQKEDVAVLREAEILNSLKSHDGVIQLIDFFETPTTFRLVTSLAYGGDLHEHLIQGNLLTEKNARNLAREILQTLHYIHSRGIVHRDVKAANILIMEKSNDVQVKIADFGFATFYRADNKDPNKCGLKTRCGTPAYVAPEIILGKRYNEKVDMWSYGVLLYLLLGGHCPFVAENEHNLFSKICSANYAFNSGNWNEISKEARQLVSSFLTLDPTKRIDAGSALGMNQWLKRTSNIRSSS